MKQLEHTIFGNSTHVFVRPGYIDKQIPKRRLFIFTLKNFYTHGQADKVEEWLYYTIVFTGKAYEVLQALIFALIC